MENKEQRINQNQLGLGPISSNQADHENDRSVGNKRKSKSDDNNEGKAMKTSTCDQEESLTRKPDLNVNSNLEQEKIQVNFYNLCRKLFCRSI